MTETGKKNEGFLALLRNDSLRPLRKQKTKDNSEGQRARNDNLRPQQKRLKAKEEAGRKATHTRRKATQKRGERNLKVEIMPALLTG